MYSYEITDIMNRYNFTLPSSVYQDIWRKSPQLNHCIYKPFGDYFEMWDNEGNHWKFSVYYGQ